ncbi:MAG: cupin domain-containing protein [Haloarculaceae archaeon]
MAPEPVNVEVLSWRDYEHGERTFRRKQLARAAGGEELGASLYQVPAGKRTWLRHYHEGNEEALFVLDGDGTLFLGPEETEHALAPGDYVALPRGEESSHEVVAGEEGLRYLAFSTMNDPDVTVYPDEDKIGVYAGSAPGAPTDQRAISKYLDFDAEVPYWDE